MFFSLFGIVSKIAQFIGPVTISAVTGATQNTRLAFILCAITAVLPLVVVAFINMERADVRLKVYEEQERRKSQEQPILGGDGGNRFSDHDTDDDIMNSEGENEILYVPPLTAEAGSIPSITPSSNNTNNHQKSSDGYNNYGYGL